MFFGVLLLVEYPLNMSFSPDGIFMLVTTADSHDIFVTDWKKKHILLSAKAHYTDVRSAKFNPFQYYTNFGEAPTYTISTCGRNHVKFWTPAEEGAGRSSTKVLMHVQAAVWKKLTISCMVR